MNSCFVFFAAFKSEKHNRRNVDLWHGAMLPYLKETAFNVPKAITTFRPSQENLLRDLFLLETTWQSWIFCMTTEPEAKTGRVRMSRLCFDVHAWAGLWAGLRGCTAEGNIPQKGRRVGQIASADLGVALVCSEDTQSLAASSVRMTASRWRRGAGGVEMEECRACLMCLGWRKRSTHHLLSDVNPSHVKKRNKLKLKMPD